MPDSVGCALCLLVCPPTNESIVWAYLNFPWSVEIFSWVHSTSLSFWSLTNKKRVFWELKRQWGMGKVIFPCQFFGGRPQHPLRFATLKKLPRETFPAIFFFLAGKSTWKQKELLKSQHRPLFGDLRLSRARRKSPAFELGGLGGNQSSLRKFSEPYSAKFSNWNFQIPFYTFSLIVLL